MVHKILAPIEDDTEDAPWMVMGTLQSHATSVFYVSLREEFHAQGKALFVADFLPILYYPIAGEKREQLAPDVLVARVPIYDRPSFDVEDEGVAPAFVLEVTSVSSLDRDIRIKRERYEVMGVEEYAIFAPEMPDGAPLLTPPLQGHRRDLAKDEFVTWEPDEQGRLYSQVLGLWLVARDGELRLQRPDGSMVPTPAEDRLGRERAQFERDRERAARQRAEAELARLRAELERRPDQ